MRRGRGRRHGALLLEVVLALAVFIMAGLAVLSAVERAAGSAEWVRDMHMAADLARSAMSRIEAGLDDPIALSGPARRWMDDDAPPESAGPGWTLRIETTPSPFDGLTLVAVTAQREESRGARAVSCTLRQLVRLRGPGEQFAARDGGVLAAEGGGG